MQCADRFEGIREKAQRLYAEALREKNKYARAQLFEEASRYFRKSITVTPEMVMHLIGRLRDADVEFIVAPFEADAQMAHLASTGAVSGIITEDSDLVSFCIAIDARVFVLMKMTDTGEGDVIHIAQPHELATVNAPVDFKVVKKSSETSTKTFICNLANMDARAFVQMIILAGCDYLDSIPGIGVFSKRARWWQSTELQTPMSNRADSRKSHYAKAKSLRLRSQISLRG